MYIYLFFPYTVLILFQLLSTGSQISLSFEHPYDLLNEGASFSKLCCSRSKELLPVGE